MSNDPVETNPTLYRTVFENERVRVLEYLDHPGESTRPHAHPDSVMITLSSFDRRLVHGEQEVTVHLERGEARWLDAQEHSGHNVGDTDTHTFFIELKEPASQGEDAARLGPSAR